MIHGRVSHDSSGGPASECRIFRLAIRIPAGMPGDPHTPCNVLSGAIDSLQMAARGVTGSVVDSRAAEVERIVESPALHGSESLCRLLRYLANRTIHEPGVTIREHEIAAEVFGRSSFDPRIDSTVRVNVTRLRAKLIEYYSGPGAQDPVHLELPKGSYSV